MSAATPSRQSHEVAADVWIGPIANDADPCARYRDGSDMDPSGAPRPYLHPVRTLAGTVVTDVRPADHPHHMGFSLAVPDVNGTQYWGGMSYVDGQGYVWLDNEGSQTVTTRSLEEDRLEESLEWRSPRGLLQATETRSMSTRGTPGGYLLQWRSALTGVEDLSIGSPASNGRAGAGYGGLFWRFPHWPDAIVLVEGGQGEDAAHGSTSPWLAVSSPNAWAGVILIQHGPEFPWFVRTEEYLGACPALAWSDALEVPAGRPLSIGLDAIVCDTVFQDRHAVEAALKAAGLKGDHS